MYEKRREPRADQVDVRRSYIIALTQRGVHALESAGVHIPKDEVAYLGTVVHPYRGKPRIGEADPGAVSYDRCVSIWWNSWLAGCNEGKDITRRVELAQHLINENRRLAPDNITYHFEHACEDINFAARSIVVGTPEGQTQQVGFCTY